MNIDFFYNFLSFFFAILLNFSSHKYNFSLQYEGENIIKQKFINLLIEQSMKTINKLLCSAKGGMKWRFS